MDPVSICRGPAMVGVPEPGMVISILRTTAEEEILPRFRRLTAGDIGCKKHPSDLVTTADIEAEKRLSAALTALLAGSVVVGEEGTEAHPQQIAALAGTAPVWLIDPVDGTNNFVEGRACFAIVVGLCLGGQVIAGWIHDPIADETVCAVAGEGAWLISSAGETRLRVAAPRPLEGMRGSLSHRLGKRVERRRTMGLGPALGEIVRYGSTGREYMDLAQGVLHFARYTRLKPWDHAAGVLIHQEAGGVSGLTADGGAYRPEPRVMEETVLLAPDREAWLELNAFFREIERSGTAS
jgi:fructose-1,6-bisphosphatase/inositol monophosphatase family enzyme